MEIYDLPPYDDLWCPNNEKVKMKNLEKLIYDIQEELIRTKLMCAENGYHHGTSINSVVSRYRKELEELLQTIRNDFHIEKIENYSDIDKKYERN